MDIQDVLVYIIVACCLLWTFSAPSSAEKENQTDVDADVVAATDVLHTRTKEALFLLAHFKMPFSGRQRQLPFVFRFTVHTPALEFGRKHYLCGSSFRHPQVHGSAVSRLAHFKYDATTARQRYLGADEAQMCRMRCHTECTESRFQRFNAGDVL